MFQRTRLLECSLSVAMGGRVAIEVRLIKCFFDDVTSSVCCSQTYSVK